MRQLFAYLKGVHAMKPKAGQKRVLMLNSGGFDSAVLYHKLVSDGYMVYSLFFDFGQNNVVEEHDTVVRMCGGENLRILKLPSFDWSGSSITSGGECTEDLDKIYVEMRNLIFLSYAVSIAEAQAIRSVYYAVSKSPGMYKDTSDEFVKHFNDISRMCDVEVFTPFADTEKKDLIHLAKEYGIGYNDFFSCYYPTEAGRPCGECLDCVFLEELYANKE